METNFEKMLQSMKQYIDDQDDKSSPIDHEHAQYVKRNVLANVAFTGSFYDLKDIPDLQDAITKEELEEILQDYFASDQTVINMVKELLNVENVEINNDYTGKISLAHVYAILNAMKDYIYYNSLMAGSPIYVNAEAPEDIHKIWMDTTDDLIYVYSDITMDAMDATINVFKAELKAMKDELEYLKRHGIGGSTEDGISKFALLLETGDTLDLLTGDSLDTYDTE